MPMICEIPRCSNKATEKHHWLSRQAHGKRALIKENEIRTCAWCHNESHYIGQKLFAQKHGLTDRFEKAREAVWKLEAGLKESEG